MYCFRSAYDTDVLLSSVSYNNCECHTIRLELSNIESIPVSQYGRNRLTLGRDCHLDVDRESRDGRLDVDGNLRAIGKVSGTICVYRIRIHNERIRTGRVTSRAATHYHDADVAR